MSNERRYSHRRYTEELAYDGAQWYTGARGYADEMWYTDARQGTNERL